MREKLVSKVMCYWVEVASDFGRQWTVRQLDCIFFVQTVTHGEIFQIKLVIATYTPILIVSQRHTMFVCFPGNRGLGNMRI